MKIIQILIFFLLVLLSGQPLWSQDFFNGKFDRDKHYVLLAHPTVQSLRNILFLADQEIFDTDDADFVGVYHRDENYDFRQSIDFIREENISRVHFQEISGHLDVADIYRENSCTKDFRTIFENSAGIIFFGGPDIQPGAYHEQNLFAVVTDPNRHLFELSLLFHLLGGNQSPGFKPFLEAKPDYLVTGFCLGMQSMNVATGGSLFQDIPKQVYNARDDHEIVGLSKNKLHRNYWQNISEDTLLMGVNFHKIRFANDFFRRRVGYKKLFSPLVLSSHHQSVNRIGKGWQVTALSCDRKIIEAFRHEKYPNVFAVQFHPEVSVLYEDREKRKFAPGDKAKTYHQIIGKRGLDFHLKYWKCISDALEDAIRGGNRL